MYGSPAMQDCSHTLAALPPADPFYRYYLEPQLETTPPKFDWQGWTDERPKKFQRKVVQVPKFWSYGKPGSLRSNNQSYRGSFPDKEKMD